MILLGVLAGVLVWHVAGTLDGDALFHLARVRKLLAFADLHLRTLDEFKDGGLHPGYAFPLWHLFLAFVARLSGVGRGPRAAARGEHPLPARVRGRLRVGDRGLPEPRCCVRDAGRHGRAVRARGRSRRQLRPPGAARDDGAAGARADRWSRSSSGSSGGRRARAERRSPPALSRSRSSTRRTRCTSSCRSPATSRRGGCSRAAELRQGIAGLATLLRARARRLALAAAARPRDDVAQPVGRRAGAEPEALRRPARRLLAPQLPGLGRALRAHRRGRGRGARLRSARVLRAAPPLGCARARRAPWSSPRSRSCRPSSRPSPTSSRSRRRRRVVGFVPLAFAFAGGAAVLSRRLGGLGAAARARRRDRARARLAGRLRRRARRRQGRRSPSGSRPSAARPRSSSDRSCGAARTATTGRGG